MLAWTICCAIVSWKLITNKKLQILLYTFGNNCSTEKTQCFLSSDIWIPYLLMCGSRNWNIYTPSMEDSLICAPHPQDFLFQGVFDGPPPPRNFERFFSCAAGIFSDGQRPTHLWPGYRLPSFGNSKWFWYLKTKKVNTNSVTKVQ